MSKTKTGILTGLLLCTPLVAGVQTAMAQAVPGGSLDPTTIPKYVTPLLIPPVLLYEHAGSLLDGSIETGELAGLCIGIVLPLLGAWYMVEFASFRFSLDEDIFRWRWHNFIRHESGQVPLRRVVKISREGLQSSASDGPQYGYRLVVVLDDDTVIPLTRGYSGLYARRLERIVDQIRRHLGHYVAMR